MSLQSTLQELYQPFLVLDCAVSHYRRVGHPPYVVWAESGEEQSFNASNHKAEQQLTGTVDLYTKTEFDSLADSIQTILNSENVGWKLASVQYEEETNLIHYEWQWWIA